MTVTLIACWKKLRTPTFTMLACLALSDVHSLLQLYVWYCSKIQHLFMKCFPEYINTLRISRYSLLSVAEDNAGVQVCLLAILRYTSIAHPFKYKIYCMPKRVILASICGWTLVVIFVIARAPVLYYHISIFRYIELVLYLLRFILPTSLFLTLHYLKTKVLRRSPAFYRASALKMNVIVSILLSIYVFSSISYVLSFLSLLFEEDDTNHILLSEDIGSFLLIINCAINPFVLVLSSPQVLGIFVCIKRRSNRGNGNAKELQERGTEGSSMKETIHCDKGAMQTESL